jgi:hypothetical protein
VLRQAEELGATIIDIAFFTGLNGAAGRWRTMSTGLVRVLRGQRESRMTGRITWTQDNVSDVPLRRYVGRVGTVEVGAVEYDGANRMWVWSSPLAEDAWGWAPEEQSAKQALDVWLRGWLESFRSFLD